MYRPGGAVPIAADGADIADTGADIPVGEPGRLPTLEEVERAVILRTLQRCGGNKSEAARVLGITRKTLHARLNRYGAEDAGADTETGAGGDAEATEAG